MIKGATWASLQARPHQPWEGGTFNSEKGVVCVVETERYQEVPFPEKPAWFKNVSTHFFVESVPSFKYHRACLNGNL